MRFSFTAEQLELRDALRDLLDKECTPDVIRGGHSPELWKRLGEMGMLGLRRELDEVDLVLLLEESGRALVPGPLLETSAVGVPLLAEAGEVGWVQKVAAGNAVLTVGLDDTVPHADVADILLLVKDGTVHLVPGAELRGHPEQALSPARPVFRVEWTATDATRLEADAALAFDRGALGAAAELIGVATRLIEMAAEHAKSREQFGKPIGSFQAVKHLLADALIRLEFARPAVYRAAWSVARGVPEQSRDVSLAKALAADATTLACRNALQVHGAIGYTEEHDLHLWLKQGWALAHAWGDAAWHRERIAESVLTAHA